MSLDPHERLEELRRELAVEAATAARESSATEHAPSWPPVPEPIPTEPPVLEPAPTEPPVPEPAPTEPPVPEPPTTSGTGDGWDLAEILADTSLSTWLGVGLLATGGSMVLSWFVPGIDLIGSIIILGAGVVLLAQHFMRGAGAWALYAGAVLAGMGAARVIGDILPGSPRGLTAIGVGVAFLAISYLRHSQAGGYGWQGVVGGAALVLGLAQFVLGLLPGSPTVLDLIVPAALLIGGGLLLARGRGRPASSA